MEHRRLCGTTSLDALLFCLLLTTTLFWKTCSAEYLAEPSLRWSLQWEGTGSISSRGMRKGNAVVTHNDGIRLVATMDDGSLHVIQTSPQVRSLSVFEPPPNDNKFTECRSGATIVYPADSTSGGRDDESTGETRWSASIAANGKSYVVYAVIDTAVASDLQVDENGFVLPSATSTADEGSTTSRILAVNVDDGILKWTVEVPGRIQGDVMIGTSGIYVSHNIDNVGFLSVVMGDEDGNSADVVATLTFSSDENGPFGPPALQRDSELGDIVIVAESWGQGYSENRGGLYMLSHSPSYEDANGRGNDAYQLQRISSWPYSSVVPPLVDGDSIFLGAAGGNMAGWTEVLSSISQDEIEPSWVYQMKRNPRNQSQRKYKHYSTLV
jgi:hypothetical protein